MQGVARYEDRGPRSYGPRCAVDGDRAGSFQEEVDLPLQVPVLAQRLVGGDLGDAQGERLAIGEVSAEEGFPVNQPFFRDLFVWPRFPS